MTGSGTVADPYMIWDVNDLQDVGNGAPYGLGDYYELGQDIDASATATWNWNAVRGVFEGFRPICVAAPYFTGSFDGNNHSISDLYINRDVSYTSMIGYVSNCHISNVRLVNITVDSPAGLRTAALVSRARDASIISNCHSSGLINSGGGGSDGGLIGSMQDTSLVEDCSSACIVMAADNDIGGLIGTVDGGTIRRCFATGNVTAGNYSAGGLIGAVDYGSGAIIEDCYATGDIGGTYEVGGLIGELNSGTVRRCYATGHVSGSSSYVGGLIGEINLAGVVEESFATGDVSGAGVWGTGGLIGDTDGTVSDCYARGNVTSTGDRTGGFCGRNTGTVERCYSTGQVTGPTSVGGFAADNTDTITGCFWDTETSGQATSAGGTGKTTAEMKTLATFAGWDILGHSVHDPTGGYPWLSWQVPGASPVWYIYLLAPPPPPPPVSVLTLPATEVR